MKERCQARAAGMEKGPQKRGMGEDPGSAPSTRGEAQKKNTRRRRRPQMRAFKTKEAGGNRAERSTRPNSDFAKQSSHSNYSKLCNAGE